MKKILFMALSAAMLAGCNKDPGYDSDLSQGGEVFFSAGVATRAHDATWEADDRVGLFAYDGATAAASNAQYKITDATTGTMGTVTDADRIFYPKGKSLSFYAYYPYDAVLSESTYAVDVTDQTTAEKVKALDLLWAKATDKSTTDVALQFSHRMAQLKFTIEAGGVDISDLTGLTATLKGANATAKFNLQTGVFSDKAVADIALNVEVDADDKAVATMSAFVVPTVGLNDVVCVELKSADDKSFVWTPATAAWNAGESYSYTLTIGSTYREYGSISAVKGNYFTLLPQDKTVYKLYIADNANRYKIENLYGGGQDVEFSITNGQVSFSVPEYSYYNAAEIGDHPLHKIPTAMDHPSYGIMTAWLDSDPEQVYCEDIGENDQLILGSKIKIATWYTVAPGYFGWYRDGDSDVLQVTTIQ